jgi:RNA polymerase sigma factor (sigma-70 family)
MLLLGDQLVTVHERVVTAPNWEAVYAECAPALVRYLVRLLGDRESADDVLQDSFVKAMRARVLPADPTGVRAWLFRIAANTAIDVLRRRSRGRFLPRARQVGPTIEASGERDHLARALAAIAPEHAAVLLLRVQEGYSCSEIAQMRGISERAAKARIARARLNFAVAYDRIERGART